MNRGILSAQALAAALARISGEELRPLVLEPEMPSNGSGEGQTVDNYPFRHPFDPFVTSFNSGVGTGGPCLFAPDYEFEKSVTGDGSGKGCSGNDRGDNWR